jgi:omega-amidase
VAAAGYPARVRVHAIQTAPAWHDSQANRRSIEARIEALAATASLRGDYLLLPEMCETAWTAEPEALRAVEGSVAWICSLARRHGAWLQAGFGEVVDDGRVANAVAVAAPDGSLRAIHRKNFLFPSERHAFIEGETITLVDTGSGVVCPMICYDLRFPELWRLAALAGAELFAVSSAWPEVRHEHWRSLLVARAVENQAHLVACNRTGSDPSQRYVGGSAIVSPHGVRLAEAGAGEETVSDRFDVASVRAWREQFRVLQDTRRSLLGSIEVRRV